MNTTYLGLELRRVVRDPSTLLFVAVMPAFMYVIFGAAQSYGDTALPHGNVTMYVMISMVTFGAVVATTGIGGIAAIERMQGWGRQLGLTPMSDGQYVLVKTTVAVLISLVPIALIYVIGGFTGAKGTPTAWVASGAIVLAGSIVFALYGLMAGLLFPTEAAVGAASGAIVILAFLGNVFFPLSGAMLTFAKFTPLYGYVALARRPITGGYLVNTTTGAGALEPLWIPLTNIIVWALIFGGAALLLVRRSRSRQ